ncbi:MAG: histidine phosphatase family protein [Gemmatimonadetes bacterium]|nr:histidine phosphatase family protein [Gemmatimonadota bacterium]MBT8402725.1 histidine phosphatase family protein [Gemmatimonadota bacterium]
MYRRSETTRRSVFLCLLALILAVPPALAGQTSAETEAASVVWVVRHAERTDDGMEHQADPDLSDAGHARAQALARLLSDAGITAVHSTPYARTRQTAAPLADLLGLEVGEYDPGDARAMEAFVEGLRAPGRHVVVGHSNTTPAVVQALGGDPVSPIATLEYDRIYVVTIGPDGTVSSSLLRFGAPAGG